MVKPITLVIFILLTVSGCRVGGRSGNSTNRKAEDLKVNIQGTAKDKIVFLTFKVQLQDSLRDIYKFTLTRSSVKDGVLKKADLHEETIIEPNYLYVDYTGKKERASALMKVPDPLCTLYEYPGEQHQSLIKKVIKKQEGVLNIRLQFDPANTNIYIYKNSAASGRTLKEIYHARL